MSTAIFGGTFDPVHIGHIRIARGALSQFNLDRLVVVPNGNPPHKKDEVGTDFCHRYNMLKLAFKDDAKIEISDYESLDGNYHYSLNTMRYFRDMYGKDTYFILGADSLCTVHTWYESRKFLEENKFIVFLREDDEALMKTYESYKAQGIEIHLADTPFFDASSTEIRNAFSSGREPLDLVTYEVADYIKSKGLYGGAI